MARIVSGIYIYILALPELGGKFHSKLKNREEFEGGLGKMKGKGEKIRKKKRVIKKHVKIPLYCFYLCLLYKKL